MKAGKDIRGGGNSQGRGWRGMWMAFHLGWGFRSVQVLRPVQGSLPRPCPRGGCGHPGGGR